MFDMKYLSNAKRILGIEILRDMKVGKLWCHMKDILNGCWKGST